MKLRKPTAVILSYLLFAGATGFAGAEEKKEQVPAYRLQWRDLPRMITGHKVFMKLPDGTRVQGKVLSVEPEGMVLDITKTSDKHAYAKGRGSVPRAAISDFRLVKRTGNTWKVAGTLIGLGIGGLISAFSLASVENEGGGIAAPLAAIVGGSTALGLWGGWASDKKTMLVTVVPEL